MITGYKRVGEPAASAPEGSPARVGVGILAALAVLTFWVGSLLTGGPSAARDRVDSTVAEEHEEHED
jgi:hypothetical protein